jgi:hypothetical protein
MRRVILAASALALALPSSAVAGHNFYLGSTERPRSGASRLS